jgi:hypothetical protein
LKIYHLATLFQSEPSLQTIARTIGAPTIENIEEEFWPNLFTLKSQLYLNLS